MKYVAAAFFDEETRTAIEPTPFEIGAFARHFRGLELASAIRGSNNPALAISCEVNSMRLSRAHLSGALLSLSHSAPYSQEASARNFTVDWSIILRSAPNKHLF